jgi:hypothetical protein
VQHDGRYVPILKAKQGELLAVRDLSPLIKGTSVTALLEVPLNAKATVCSSIANSWGKRDRVFIDCQSFQPGEAASTMGDLMKRGVRIVPVTSLTQSSQFNAIVSQIAGEAGHGVCLRLQSATLVEENAVAQLSDLVTQIGFQPGEIDVVADFGEFPRASIREAVILARTVISIIPQISSWRTLTIAWSAFPKTLSDLKRDSINEFPRREWEAWKALHEVDLPRGPSFGDYGINHPRREDVGIKFRPAPNLRYTTEKNYVIFRGRKSGGSEQQREICRQLIKMPEFNGSDFSPGDSVIANCATGKDGPGSPTTWRYVGTSHHLRLVAHQLANTGDS